jgi:hypothetical protein
MGNVPEMLNLCGDPLGKWWFLEKLSVALQNTRESIGKCLRSIVVAISNALRVVKTLRNAQINFETFPMHFLVS